MVNDMLLQPWHVIDGLHVQVLIIGQDDNDIWPGVRLESHLLPRPGGERKSPEADEALHRHSTANSKVRARPPTGPNGSVEVPMSIRPRAEAVTWQSIDVLKVLQEVYVPCAHKSALCKLVMQGTQLGLCY